MTDAPKQAHLGLWLQYLDGDWQEPGSRAEEVNSLEPYAEIAKAAEAAKLDAVIRGDGPSFHRGATPGHYGGQLELLTLLAALAARTSQIGLIGTASTTFNEPYNLARQLSTIDHLSGGRLGWNIVTSANGEKNFGLDALPGQEERYDRADEFVHVVEELWQSWDEGSLPIDRETGVFADHDKVRSIDHVGEHFSVEGPLNVSRSPQIRPVLIQAGSSERGKQFAAEHAEVIFTAQREIEGGRAFAEELRERVRAAGRDPEQVKILPGLGLTLAATEAEAAEIQQRKLDRIDYDEVRGKLEDLLGGADLSGIDLDAQVPAERFPDTSKLTRRQSRPQIFVDLAVKQGYTLRRVLQAFASGFGHGEFIGTPEQAADRIIEWIDAGAADGFVLFPGGGWPTLRLLTERVIPILQERGRFRTEYTGTTLRDHLGLEPVPSIGSSSSPRASVAVGA